MTEDLPVVLVLGILLTFGFLLGLLAEKINLPRIVAYILTGALFSPDLLGDTLNLSMEPWSASLTDIALAVIAYLVGAEINPGDLKKEEGTVISAVVGQSLGALVFVSAGLWGLSQISGLIPAIPLYYAMIFGAIATANAPATTLGIIDEYRAKGRLTNIILSVVALADAVCIILFTFVLGMRGESSWSDSLLSGFTEVGGALVTGALAGVLLGVSGKAIKKQDLRLPLIIGVVLLVFGVSRHFGFSMLLSCMTLGFISEVFYPKKQAEWLLPMQHIEELVFLFFFVLAGMHFELSVLTNSFLFVLVYVVLRLLGKYSGTVAGVSISGSGSSTKKYLGFCLLPQAGVAIGLAIRASNQPGLEEMGRMLMNVVLGSTIIFELVSPVITRFALLKSNDIKEPPAS